MSRRSGNVNACPSCEMFPQIDVQGWTFDVPCSILSQVDLFSDIPKKETKALSVTQLVRKMKRAIEAEVGRLWIEGEVSNLRKQGSGHWYFSLKDDTAQISCAMFGARNKEGSGALDDGTKVKIFAESTVYAARGQLQLVVERVEKSGQGDLQARFEALKKKLHAEGLFDSSRKKPIPSFPRTIGLVTSPTGAALQDILNILHRRAPWIQPVLFPVRVQGKGVEAEIARAITRLNAPERYGFPKCDLLIVGRGGGSIEDLWCFNEESVARAIAASDIPVISAVGHEIDFTIADFVSDLRAPTPSAAAEIAAPDTAELRAHLDNSRNRLVRSLRTALREPTLQIDSLTDQLARSISETINARSRSLRELSLRHLALHPRLILERRQENIVSLEKDLRLNTARRLATETARLDRLRTLVRTLGPESAFKRGFSITLAEDGSILRSKKQTASGQTILTRLIDGEISSTIR